MFGKVLYDFWRVILIDDLRVAGPPTLRITEVEFCQVDKAVGIDYPV